MPVHLEKLVIDEKQDTGMVERILEILESKHCEMKQWLMKTNRGSIGNQKKRNIEDKYNDGSDDDDDMGDNKNNNNNSNSNNNDNSDDDDDMGDNSSNNNNNINNNDAKKSYYYRFGQLIGELTDHMTTKTDLVVAKTIILQKLNLFIKQTYDVLKMSGKVFCKVSSTVEKGFEVCFLRTEVLKQTMLLIKIEDIDKHN